MSKRSSAIAAKETLPDHDPAWRSEEWPRRLRRGLLRWYDRHARDLPWRRDPTPYKVWISEIMCQQTQVATVLPYFERFLNRFPSIADVAAAEETELLKHWEGLGYYRRARAIHAAARQIVDRHDGEFPDTFEQVIALPGIGRYTASAILSIAADQRWPVLEGNTQRVYSRWIALRAPATTTASQKLLWQFAAAMLPSRGAGRFNQAAMELGALLCTPTAPRCDECPARRQCAAHRLGLETQIPGKVTKIRYEERREFAFVIRGGDDRFLVRPLPSGGRWEGMWDFPRTDRVEARSLRDAESWLGETLHANIRVTDKLKTIKHTVTKYRISLEVYAADPTPLVTQPPSPWLFANLAELRALPMSVTGRAIVDWLSKSDRHG